MIILKKKKNKKARKQGKKQEATQRDSLCLSLECVSMHVQI